METEDDCVELKDDSSFEVLSSSEEEEFSTSSSIWSGTLNSSFYESMHSSFSSITLTENTRDGNSIVDINTNTSTPRFHLPAQTVRNSDFNNHPNQEDNKKSSAKSTENEDPTSLDAIVEMDSPAFEVIKKMVYDYQPNEGAKSCFKSSEKYHLPSHDKQEMMDEAGDEHQIISSISRTHLQTKSVRNSCFNFGQSQEDLENSLIKSAEDADTKHENLPYSKSKNVVIEIDSPAFEIIEKMACQCQSIEEEEISSKASDEGQLFPEDGDLVENLVKDSESQETDSTLNVYQSKSNVIRIPLEQTSESSVVHIHPDRKNSRNMCSVMKHSLKVCRWLRNSKCLQDIVAGAKSSFYSFLNTVELEMNLMFGMEDPLRILIMANKRDSSVLEGAIYESLGGQVIISKCHIEEDRTCIPALPTGCNWALHAVQCKINNARQLIHDSENMIVVSTANFITESIPQRWQASTVLCLEDPNLQLNLHNFTSTIPVPNDYIYQAQRLTPEDYPLKKQGFAVTLEDAIRFIIKTDFKDPQEFLSGVNHLPNLKSAADILVGMYKKYTKQICLNYMRG